MSVRRAPRTAIALSLPLLALTVTRCTCADDKKTTDTSGLSARAAELYKTLFADLPKAKVTHPAAAIPSDLEWVAASPDAEAWRKWAVAQPYVQTLMKTPLFAELRLSQEWRMLDGLQHRIARAAKVTGTPEDRAALWAGPTAVGVGTAGDPEASGAPSVLLVKAIDPGTEALIRFAAAFGTLSRAEDGDATVERRKVEGVDLVVWSEPNRTVAFGLFRNLLIVGDAPDLVERAIGLAADEPMSDDDTGSSHRLPTPETPGLHLSMRFEDGDMTGLMGLDEVGVSLVADAKAPVVLRRRGQKAVAKDRLGLLAYAPESAFFAVVDGGKPSGALLSEVKARLSGSARVGDVDLEAELASKLSAGMGLVFTGAPDQGSPGGLLLLSHDDQDLEPVVRKLLDEVSSSEITRTKLDSKTKGILLRPKDGGLHAAITKDALMLAMSEDTLRAALAAGQAQAPSLKDRPLDLGPGAGGAVYVDLQAGADFLDAFTARHATDEDASEVLQPTIEAMRAGGRAFARLEGAGKTREEGALHVVP